jgi:general secretion pathway protein K
MVTLIFAVMALVVFMDKASNDLLVEQREAETRRLRREAYSALEVTLAVLEEFRLANNGLRSPAEGWGDPLGFAGYAPSEGRTVEITFEDESGKISLPRANQVVLTNLFTAWTIKPDVAEGLADALLGWMKADHVSTTGLAPSYEQSAIPYLPPQRPVRSYDELAAIDKVRDVLYDSEGHANEFWQRFVDSVSLLDFERANINGAKPDTLAAIALFDPTQQRNLADYLHGTGSFQTQGPGFFQNPGDALRIAAGASGDVGAFGPTISALRIFVTVREGRSAFRLAAVVSPPGGATTIQTTATARRAQSAASDPANAAGQPAAANPPAPNNANRASTRQEANPAAASLRYPFTLVEIRENDEIPPALPAPAEPQF